MATVKVQANGQAPKGLSVGTTVSTGGGNYKITGVNADGSYQSQKVVAPTTKSGIDTKGGYVAPTTQTASNPVPTTPVQQPTTPVQTAENNYTKIAENNPYNIDAIQQYMNAQQNAALTRQQQSRQTQLADIGQQQKDVQNKFDQLVNALNVKRQNTGMDYYNKRNQEDALSLQNYQRMREQLANQGNAMGGESVTGEISANQQRQNSINNLNMQEQQTYNDLTGQEVTANLDKVNSLNALQDKLNLIKSQGTDADNALINEYQGKIGQEIQQANEKAYNGKLALALQQVNWAKDSQQDAEKKAAQEKTDFINTIQRYSNDYQSQINNIKNDGDTTNDWQIPLLEQARAEKIQNNLKNDISTIDRYANDYQAEIDRRKATNPNDQLIPYLEVARQQKVQALAQAQTKAQQDLYNKYFDSFKQIGYVNSDDMASVLGLPKGTTTSDYNKIVNQIAIDNQKQQNDNLKTQYDISKPYYKPESSTPKEPTATEKKYQDMGEDYNTLKAMSVDNAVNAMKSRWGEIVTKYGPEGANQLWNTVLADAIEAGQATKK